MTLALHMNQQGENAWPSQALLAQRTGLSERSVRTHLAKAGNAEWLRIYERRRTGQAWFVHEYVATIPNRLAELCKTKPWEDDPNWQRPEFPSARSTIEEYERTPTAQHPANGAGHPEAGTEAPAIDDTTAGNSRHDTRNQLPTNSSSNSSVNSPRNTPCEGALACTDARKKGISKKEMSEPIDQAPEEPKRFSDEELFRRVKKLASIGEGVSDIARKYQQYGVTEDHVMTCIRRIAS